MLKFETPVIFLGEGEGSRMQLDVLQAGIFPMIAADGGANDLETWSKYPSYIIGDLDSLKNRNYFEGNCQILERKDSSSTDLEKCLNEVESPLILALGFTGKRFDHTLEILHVMRKYQTKNMVFFSKEDVMFRMPLHFSARLPKGTRVSLYPLEKTQPLESKGLKYSLDNLELEQGILIGTSNEVETEFFEVRQREAQLMGIFPIEHTGILLKAAFKPDWTALFPHLLNAFL